MARRHSRLITAGLIGLALVVSAGAAMACGDDDGDSTPTARATSGTTRTATTGTAPAGSATAGATSASGTPATSGTAQAGGTTVKVATAGSLGQILTDSAGLTLYTFKNDTAGSGTSACSGGCASAWPPATVTGTPTKPAEATGEIGTIRRDDGTMQVTYKGMPLYRFAQDSAPGDTKGQGVGNIWFVAQP